MLERDRLFGNHVGCSSRIDHQVRWGCTPFNALAATFLLRWCCVYAATTSHKLVVYSEFVDLEHIVADSLASAAFPLRSWFLALSVQPEGVHVRNGSLESSHMAAT